ncbi:MAG TPA: DNA-3-methyladenine glycosylase I [Candidatus Tumulicola sp.]|jgi:DNA-3-methyladenine glycosylase I
MARYHDEEWGVPLHDDRGLFQFVTLEGAQAGLSWDTILRKRDRYRTVFYDFDPQRVARMRSASIERVLTDSGIVRNRAKVLSTVSNAKAFLEVAREHGSFDAWAWTFVDGTPIVNAPKTAADIPVSSDEARAFSKALLARGFKFVGPTICYAFMQAVGMVNDHVRSCFRFEELTDRSRAKSAGTRERPGRRGATAR